MASLNFHMQNTADPVLVLSYKETSLNLQKFSGWDWDLDYLNVFDFFFFGKEVSEPKSPT